MTNPLKKQVGGSHYKNFVYQPIEFFMDMKLNFIQCNIIKYIFRHKSKNGIEDVKKAKHYAEIGMSVGAKYDNVYDTNDAMKCDMFVDQIDGHIEQDAIRFAIFEKYNFVIKLCDELIHNYEYE